MRPFNFAVFLLLSHLDGTFSAADECQTDTGGTCYLFECYMWRGETECSSDNKCVCSAGYCAGKTGTCVPKGSPKSSLQVSKIKVHEDSSAQTMPLDVNYRVADSTDARCGKLGCMQRASCGEGELLIGGGFEFQFDESGDNGADTVDKAVVHSSFPAPGDTQTWVCQAPKGTLRCVAQCLPPGKGIMPADLKLIGTFLLPQVHDKSATTDRAKWLEATQWKPVYCPNGYTVIAGGRHLLLPTVSDHKNEGSQEILTNTKSNFQGFTHTARDLEESRPMTDAWYCNTAMNGATVRCFASCARSDLVNCITLKSEPQKLAHGSVEASIVSPTCPDGFVATGGGYRIQRTGGEWSSAEEGSKDSSIVQNDGRAWVCSVGVFNKATIECSVRCCAMIRKSEQPHHSGMAFRASKFKLKPKSSLFKHGIRKNTHKHG